MWFGALLGWSLQDVASLGLDKEYTYQDLNTGRQADQDEHGMEVNNLLLAGDRFPDCDATLSEFFAPSARAYPSTRIAPAGRLRSTPPV